MTGQQVDHGSVHDIQGIRRLAAEAGRTDPKFKRVILWAGDQPGWNGEIPIKPHTYPTRPEVVTALQIANVKVFAFNTKSEDNGIDGSSRIDNLPQQATEIADATCGEVFTWSITLRTFGNHCAMR